MCESIARQVILLRLDDGAIDYGAQSSLRGLHFSKNKQVSVLFELWLKTKKM